VQSSPPRADRHQCRGTPQPRRQPSLTHGLSQAQGTIPRQPVQPQASLLGDLSDARGLLTGRSAFARASCARLCSMPAAVRLWWPGLGW
jgi:hypothetical protein